MQSKILYNESSPFRIRMITRLMRLPCARKMINKERLDHLAKSSKEKMTLTWKGVHRRLTHGTWTLVKILIIQMKLITKLPTLDWRIINDTPSCRVRRATGTMLSQGFLPSVFCLHPQLRHRLLESTIVFVHPQSYSEELSRKMF